MTVMTMMNEWEVVAAIVNLAEIDSKTKSKMLARLVWAASGTLDAHLKGGVVYVYQVDDPTWTIGVVYYPCWDRIVNPPTDVASER